MAMILPIPGKSFPSIFHRDSCSNMAESIGLAHMAVAYTHERFSQIRAAAEEMEDPED